MPIPNSNGIVVGGGGEEIFSYKDFLLRPPSHLLIMQGVFHSFVASLDDAEIVEQCSQEQLDFQRL